jgi:hypothetical protein
MASTKRTAMKEISALEFLLRTAAKLAAAAGVGALLLWLTWVMLDIEHLQSGFTLP